jgi:glucose-1-phosphate adenylyltransferase
MRSRRGSILALVLAGGEGDRLSPLTNHRAKPAMPFAGVYRLIDFPLSNCHHSRISDVWVVQQYEAHSLAEHLANGRPWDLDRTFGGLRIVQPYTGDPESGFYEGNADAIHRNREAIEQFDPELVLVLSADAIYTLDYRDVVDRHRESAAELTIVTTEVPREDASRFGVVEAGGDGRVTGFEYKPEEPKTGVVTTEVFVYETGVLLEALLEIANGAGELKDFGDALLPLLVERGRAYAYDLGGYWRDVGTLDSYWATHMDLVKPEPLLRLDDPAWPILTFAPQRPPARIEPSAELEHALVSPGSTIGGRVVGSVLGPGVVVEEGAEVRDAVVLHDARIAANVSRAIVDAGVVVEHDVSGGDEIAVAPATEDAADSSP